MQRDLVSRIGLAAIVALMAVGCGQESPVASTSSPTISAPASASPSTWRVTSSSLPINRSLKADQPFRTNVAPRFNKPWVHAMSNGTLRVTISVNNDDSGYAWPSANGVGHVRVDGVDWYVVDPDVYGSMASVDIPLSAGFHSVVLVEDFYATHDLVGNTIGDVTISSGQLIEQGADFDDKACHPSCP